MQSRKHDERGARRAVEVAVTLADSVVIVEHLVHPRDRFRIGRGPGVELSTQAVADEAFALVEAVPSGEGFVFSWTDGMVGDMTLGDRVTPLEHLPRSGTVPDEGRIRVALGPATVFVSSVAPP